MRKEVEWGVAGVGIGAKESGSRDGRYTQREELSVAVVLARVFLVPWVVEVVQVAVSEPRMAAVVASPRA